MTRRRKLILAVTAVVLVCAMAMLAFFQGVFYANRKATITMANDGCFYAIQALAAMKDPKQAGSALLFDIEMDSCASKLAEMCLKYSGQIERKHYNILVRVRNYRERYGRDAQRGVHPSYAETDRKIAEAIAHLESIHNMKDWVPYKLDPDSGRVRAE